MIVDITQRATATALSRMLQATGAVPCKSLVLMTPEAVDVAVEQSVIYGPPV